MDHKKSTFKVKVILCLFETTFFSDDYTGVSQGIVYDFKKCLIHLETVF